MAKPFRYAFIDESGTTDPFSSTHFLAVALLSTTQPRAIELLVKRAHKKFGTSLASGEMKADSSQESVIEWILRAIVREPVAIVATIYDKRAIMRPPKDLEDIYRTTITRTVWQAVSRWPRLELCLDKRYTARRLRYALEKEIREGIVDLDQEVVIIHQEDSVSCRALQAADFVAWAFFQKYEHGDTRFCEILADRVVVEEVLRQSLW